MTVALLRLSWVTVNCSVEFILSYQSVLSLTQPPRWTSVLHALDMHNISRSVIAVPTQFVTLKPWTNPANCKTFLITLQNNHRNTPYNVTFVCVHLCRDIPSIPNPLKPNQKIGFYESLQSSIFSKILLMDRIWLRQNNHGS